MVYRIYVEKKPGLCHEADALKSELVSIMGITALQNVRIYNRYDVENIEKDLVLKSTEYLAKTLDVVLYGSSEASESSIADVDLYDESGNASVIEGVGVSGVTNNSSVNSNKEMVYQEKNALIENNIKQALTSNIHDLIKTSNSIVIQGKVVMKENYY